MTQQLPENPDPKPAPANGGPPAEAQKPRPAPPPTETALAITPNEPQRALSAFSSEAAFTAGLRMAKALAASSLVPAQYQNNIPNVLIAMELANRIGCSVFMAMQNLDVIHGNPGWRAKFLIATVNASGRFTPLRFRWQGKEGTDTWGCRAVAKDRSDGQECVGPLVTIKIAKDEGWYQRKGSKWQTMPELMLMYRSGTFWSRVFCPELSLGMSTAEEIIDTSGVEVPDADLPAGLTPGSSKALEQELMDDPNGPDGEKVEEPPSREPGVD